MPLGTKQDLKKVPLNADIKFIKNNGRQHIEIEGQEYVIQQRENKSFFIIGKEGILGILIERTFPNLGHRIILFKRKRMIYDK